MQRKRQSILLFLPAFLLSSAAALATVTVTVSSPANNATVPTSLNFVASATTDASGARVTGWDVYVDSVSAWSTSGPTSSINAPVTMGAGTHNVIVRAWDSTGAFGSQTMTLTAAACSGICVTVTSPALTGSVSSPVHFTASAVDSAGHRITGYIVYEDGKDQYRNYTSTFDAQVAVSGGSHTFTVRAWDSTGAFGTSAAFTMAVSGTYKTVKHHDHVVVVALENRSYESAYSGPVGNSSAPYYNNTLIAKYGLTNNFYANGHDSLSQYWWMMDGTDNCVSGQTGGCNSNPTNLVATADSLIREVIAAGATWKQYTDSLPSRGYIVEEPNGIAGSNPAGTYYSRHAPAVYLSDVRQGTPTNQAVDCTGAPAGYDAATQACNVVNFADSTSGFLADLNAGRLPNFSLVVPNGCHDSHDGTSSTCSPSGIAAADAWLQTNIGALLGSSYFQPGGDGLLIVWWDEGDVGNSAYTGPCASGGTDDRSTASACGGGGRVAVVVAAPDLVSAGFKSSTYHQHPAVTRTVVEALGLSVPGTVAGTNGMPEFFP
ncbi:MAG TPA: alkaline phosphatase family protein [Thermoanaerobaculia bacterium]|jgi:acid phosphatase